MNDNVIAYILSLVCIIFILIEIVSVNKKKGFVKIIVAKRIRRRNKSNKNGELPFL